MEDCERVYMSATTFLSLSRKVLDEMPRKVAWYPGSAQKKAAFKRKFPKSSDLGVEVQADSRPEGYMPWSVADDLDPAQVCLPWWYFCFTAPRKRSDPPEPFLTASTVLSMAVSSLE